MICDEIANLSNCNCLLIYLLLYFSAKIIILSWKNDNAYASEKNLLTGGLDQFIVKDAYFINLSGRGTAKLLLLFAFYTAGNLVQMFLADSFCAGYA